MDLIGAVSVAVLVIGLLITITGVVLFVKKIGTGENAKIKFLGVDAEVGNSSLFIFIAGVGMIIWAASALTKQSPQQPGPVNPSDSSVVRQPGTGDNTIDGYIKIDNTGKRDLNVMLADYPGHACITKGGGYFSLTYPKSILQQSTDSVAIDILGYGVVKVGTEQKNIIKNFVTTGPNNTITGRIKVNNTGKKNLTITLANHTEYITKTQDEGYFSITYPKTLLHNSNNSDSISINIVGYDFINVGVNQQDILKNFVRALPPPPPVSMLTISGHVLMNNACKEGVCVNLATHPECQAKTSATGYFAINYPKTFWNNMDQVKLLIDGKCSKYVGYRQTNVTINCN